MFNSSRIGLQGQYKLVVVGPSGKRETDWFDNLITNIGMDCLGTTTAPAKYARVGTGTANPAFSDTQLVNQVGSSALGTASSIIPYGAPTYKSEIIMRYAFTQGQVIGNITEIGIGWAQTGPTLFSRTLVKDAADNPTNLTLTALDTLLIYYKITVNPPIVDYVSTTILNSTTTLTYTSRISTAGSFYNSSDTFLVDGNAPYIVSNTGNRFVAFCSGSTLGPITGIPSTPPGAPNPQSSVFNVSSVNYGPYIAGNFYRDAKINLAPDQGNVSGGISAVVIPFANSYFSVQMLFGVPIPKTDSRGAILDCRISWYRL